MTDETIRNKCQLQLCQVPRNTLVNRESEGAREWQLCYGNNLGDAWKLLLLINKQKVLQLPTAKMLTSETQVR